MQKNLYLNQKFTKFINNENFEFDRSKILKILNSDLLEDAYRTISKWQKYQPTPLESLNKLCKELGLKNIFSVPELKKVVINMGLGIDASDKKKLEAAIEDLKKITGQMPIVTKTKKAIANFKTKKDMAIGCKVTLRRKRMYEFIDRLVNIALPRIKDFRGLSSNGFDKFGNYTFGIKEHIIFPEVNFDKVDKIRGLDITIVINSQSKDHSFELLKKLNFPFKNKGDN